ncbi:MAG: hypothetical protein JKP97_04280 [Rhodobacteraceae bacterium]|jgi:hypothetical protein|nr:hypothetical protein [Paracoccaceae bacterium]
MTDHGHSIGDPPEFRGAAGILMIGTPRVHLPRMPIPAGRNAQHGDERLARKADCRFDPAGRGGRI